MKVFGFIRVSLVVVLVLFALIGAGEAHGDQGMPPPPPGAGFMMDEPKQPDAPKGFDGVPDHHRTRRQMPPDVPNPPMPNDMPMPGK